MTRYDYAIHWYALLFPDLPQNEYEKLKEDIRVNGQLQPIVVDQHTVLDGRHRLKIAQELNITPYTILFRDVHNVRPDMTPEDFIDAVNLHRRHMTDDQRVMLATLRAEGLEKAARDRQLAGVPSGENTQRSRDAIAKQAKVTPNKARQAKELKTHHPELAREVAQGKTTLKAARKKVKKLRFVLHRAAQAKKPKPSVIDIKPSLAADQAQVSEVMSTTLPRDLREQEHGARGWTFKQLMEQPDWLAMRDAILERVAKDGPYDGAAAEVVARAIIREESYTVEHLVEWAVNLVRFGVREESSNEQQSKQTIH
jgi:ParB-like nuclease domain